jgi:hypothetical protein
VSEAFDYERASLVYGVPFIAGQRRHTFFCSHLPDAEFEVKSSKHQASQRQKRNETVSAP